MTAPLQCAGTSKLDSAVDSGGTGGLSASVTLYWGPSPAVSSAGGAGGGYSLLRALRGMIRFFGSLRSKRGASSRFTDKPGALISAIGGSSTDPAGAALD